MARTIGLADLPAPYDLPGGYVPVCDDYRSRWAILRDRWARRLSPPPPHLDDRGPSCADDHADNIWGVHWTFEDDAAAPTWYATGALHQGTAYRRALEVLTCADDDSRCGCSWAR